MSSNFCLKRRQFQVLYSMRWRLKQCIQRSTETKNKGSGTKLVFAVKIETITLKKYVSRRSG